MNSVYHKLGYFFVVFFIAGVFLTGFYLFRLPDNIQDLANNATAIEATKLIPLLDKLNYLAMGTGFAGLIALMLVLLESKNGNAGNIVYMETLKNDEESKKANNDSDKAEESKYIHKIEEIEKILEQEGSDELLLNRLLSKVCRELEASQGAIFKSVFEEEGRHIELCATFAYSVPDSKMVRFEFGEGLAGQAAKSGRMLNLKNVPEGYIRILSGLGSSSPNHLIIIPVMDGELALGVIEIASFIEFASQEEDFLKSIASLLAKKLAKAKEVAEA